jgi:hypothetical protein
MTTILISLNEKMKGLGAIRSTKLFVYQFVGCYLLDFPSLTF